MTERSMTGNRLGANTVEDETGAQCESQRTVGFDCPREHHCTVVFVEEAEIPAVWPCPRCGTDALRTGDYRLPLMEQKTARTHWDTVRQRRSLPDLESLLAERLALLHTGENQPPPTA